jgi:hypothetical protein
MIQHNFALWWGASPIHLRSRMLIHGFARARAQTVLSREDALALFEPREPRLPALNSKARRSLLGQ